MRPSSNKAPRLQGFGILPWFLSSNPSRSRPIRRRATGAEPSGETSAALLAEDGELVRRESIGGAVLRIIGAVSGDLGAKYGWVRGQVGRQGAFGIAQVEDDPCLGSGRGVAADD